MTREFFDARYNQLGGKCTPVNVLECIRVNTLRANGQEIISRLEKKGVVLKKLPFTRHGHIVVKSSFSLGAITEFLLGYYYVQEGAAQVPVEVLAPQPGEVVLDACASPGGKTTQLAAMMNNTGVLVALEKRPHRIERLVINLERMSVENSVVLYLDAVQVSELGMTFDKILVDAPCSGNYAGDKDWFEKRDVAGIETSVKIQRSILRACLSVLKKGGVLVYSTCSLEPEENELQMQWLLEQFHDVVLEETTISIGDPGLTDVFGKKLDASIAKCRRFWPYKTGTEGFFVAKVRKC